MFRNPAILISGDAEDFDRAIGQGNLHLVSGVARRIQMETEAVQGATDLFPHRCRVLTNSSCEDQAIHPTHNGQIAADHLAHAVGKGVDGEGGMGIPICGLEEHLQVSAETGEAGKPDR